LARSRFNKANQVTVANLDQVVIVMSLREPELNTHRLDRFLVLAEASELRAVICLNKADMVPKRSLKRETKPLFDLYNGLGYVTLVVSAETDLGIEELRHELKGHISAVLGSSGVGKSSLVNAVQPGLHLWVGDVMDIGKGRHTTTDVSLHPLDEGGYIADTPGIKTVSLLEREDVNLPQCFPEFRAFESQLPFQQLPAPARTGLRRAAGCEDGGINAARFESYKAH
jgi:ribosome biogenesis GTPase